MADNSQGPAPARAQLTDLQSQHPPIYLLNSIGSDRPRALAGVLQEEFPPRLLELLHKDQLVIGEIGQFTPDIRTLPAGPDNFIIGVNSGLMDFYYAVGRAAHGRAIIYVKSAIPENAPAISPQDMQELIVKALTNWRSLCQPGFWESIFGTAKHDTRIEHANFGMTENVKTETEMLVTSAELFMVAHELGHVALDSGACPPIHHEDESDADAWGLTMYLPCAERRFRRRMALAGMAFAVRITFSLTSVGVKFSKAYRPPMERLQLLLDKVRAESPSEQYFDESATVVVNYLDLMDSVDARITGKPPANPIAEWQARVRLIAVLEGVAEQMKPDNEFEIMWRLTAAKAPPEVMSRIAQKLTDYYLRDSRIEPYQGKETRDRMANALPRLIAQFPGTLQTYFPAAKPTS